MFQYVKRKKGLQARFRLSLVCNSDHFKLSQLCTGCAAARSWGTAGRRNDLKLCQSCLVAVQRHSAESAAAQEHEARWFFQQLIVGLDYCHKMVRLRLCSRGSCRANCTASFALSAAYGLCNLPSSGIRQTWGSSRI